MDIKNMCRKYYKRTNEIVTKIRHEITRYDDEFRIFRS